MKICIVHDYFREFGGGERVVEALHEVWPEAPVYTSFTDWSGMGLFASKLKSLNLKTSWAQYFWAIKKYPGLLRFLMPFVWKSFNFDDFDIVISSSGANISKGIKTGPKTLHLCYCHTPPHYLYGYTTSVALEKYWPSRVYSQLLTFFLRYYDFQTSQKVDYFIANSEEVKARIKKFYRREATVIYPPVSLPKKLPDKVRPTQQYFLTGGRLERFKNFDLIIKAFNKLRLPLFLYGTGRQENNLKKIAGPTINFLGQISDQALASYYLNSQAFIFASENEDFGITPVEAQAYGKPVIAFYSGGVKETVIEGKTGLFFRELTPDSLVQTVGKFAKLKFDPEVCQAQAKKFSKERFKKEIKKFVEKKWQGFQRKMAIPKKVNRILLFDQIPADSVDKNHLTKKLQDFAHQKRKRKVFYLNAQALEIALTSHRYLKILQKADLVTVDGWAPILVARLQGKKLPEKISIGDYLPQFLKMAQKQQFSFYLLGSRQAVIEKAVENLRRKYPKLRILGWHHGYFNKLEEKKVIQEINQVKPDFLLVGLGIPKQEEWLEKNFPKLKARVFLGIGGTFDFLSGKMPRAPLWMRNLCLEWIFRLCLEPGRLWERYLLGFPKLGFKTLTWQLQQKV